MPTEEFFFKTVKLTNTTSDRLKQEVERGVGTIFCSSFIEEVPKFDKAPCETILPGSHNSFIILGRDRNASWASGNGGKGMVQCGMIDLVAGRGQLIIADNENNNKDPLDRVSFVGPMFHSDAARIYITQKAEDIDQYFGLKPSGGPHAINKSAVAAKADQVRLIGREKVRIYCGRGNFDGFETGIGETNSLGERLQGQVMHPMVLGNKLVDYFKKKNKKEKKVYQMLNTINMNLMVLNGIVSALPGAAVVLGPFMKENTTHFLESILTTLNTYLEEIDSLDDDLIPGGNNFLSDSVYTT
jgi:hypothetical protein